MQRNGNILYFIKWHSIDTSNMELLKNSILRTQRGRLRNGKHLAPNTDRLKVKQFIAGSWEPTTRRR